MRIYSNLEKRLKVLETAQGARRGQAAFLLLQRFAGVNEWEMRCQQNPYYGQTRTLEEWESIAKANGVASVILLSAPGGVYVEPAGNLAEFDG